MEGRKADVLRFGLGARNWLIMQFPDDLDFASLPKPNKGRSAQEILDHILLVMTTVFSLIAEEMKIELISLSSSDGSEQGSGPKGQLYATYDIYKELCQKLSDEMLDAEISLPQPSRLRRATIDRTLRIMAGYHVVHHAGQIAMVVSRSK